MRDVNERRAFAAVVLLDRFPLERSETGVKFVHCDPGPGICLIWINRPGNRGCYCSPNPAARAWPPGVARGFGGIFPGATSRAVERGIWAGAGVLSATGLSI